ncbi:Secreted RxLR effector protein [Erysiphe necator]|nr:Secreted RxLR effector protein [Erysiphe necator]
MEKCHYESTPMEQGTKDWLVPNENQANIESIRLFQRIMGSINCLSCLTRMNITFAYSALIRYLHNPSPAHLKARKRILRYLAGTRYLAIKFSKDANDRHKLHGYSDANLANFDLEGYKSHSGWLFYLSGGIISASSKLQSTVAL